jgi:hypothetical protein
MREDKAGMMSQYRPSRGFRLVVLPLDTEIQETVVGQSGVP